jgi:hypothetical protein
MDEESHRRHSDRASWSCQCCRHGKNSDNSLCYMQISLLLVKVSYGVTAYNRMQHMPGIVPLKIRSDRCYSVLYYLTTSFQLYKLYGLE